MTHPTLLALDWGTSSLRAYLMQDGHITDSRSSSHGIQHLPAAGRAGFEQAFAQLVGDWLQRWPHLAVVASGMVGSAQGWCEAPYVRSPASVHTLAEHSVRVSTGLGGELRIAPGVLLDTPDALPDVMRGEEIQVAGALHLHPSWATQACMVMPGTHSKWVHIQDGMIQNFASYMTGEVFAVLTQHSILGRLLPSSNGAPTTHTDPVQQADRAQAFALGVRTACDSRPGDLLRNVFATRTLGLTTRVPPHALADYLSGLLIGNEWVSGLAHAALPAEVPLVLIGDASLCQRYVQALALLDARTPHVMDNTAPTGLWHLAKTAGWLPAMA